jgi:hypothetical protein
VRDRRRRRPSPSRPSGGGARLLHVLGHDVHRPAELLGRAELAHVLALTLVIGQPQEERGQVRVLGVRLEAHGPPALEVLEVTFVSSPRTVANAGDCGAGGLNNRMTAGEHPTDYFHGDAHERRISARYEKLRFSTSQAFKAMQLEAYTRGEDLVGSGTPDRATPHFLQALVLGDIADKKERAEQVEE